MSSRRKIAVILSGCGHQDGAEIHEATLTLWAIHRHGADFQCFAPDIMQHHVLNHITGEEMAESRNVLVESARIARGDIRDLKECRASEYDGVILPGGFGAAKNLSDYAFRGTALSVNNDLRRILREMRELGRPIGALCIAPVLLAAIFGDVEVTIGQDPATAAQVEEMGARHRATMQGEVVVDRANRIVTTPCYMLDSRVDQIGEGVDHLVREILGLMEQDPA